MSKPHIDPNLLASTSTQQKRIRTYSTENESGASNLKKPRPLQAAAESRGRKRTQNKDTELSSGQVKKQNTSGGLKQTVHGIVYQIKLLMLFLKRGLDQGYSFELETEMDAAEKFDDVVLLNDAKKEYRFLQAKHKLNKDGKIKNADLLAEKDNDFSLQKYFLSYCKIKQNPKFYGFVLKDFVICTNIGLEPELEKSFESVTSEDTILMFNDKKSKRLKLKVYDYPYKEKLYSTLRKVSDLNRLADRLAQCVFKKKRLDLVGPENIFRSYHGVVGKKVIEKTAGKEGKTWEAIFRANFLDGQSDELKNLRIALFNAYKEKKRKKGKNTENEMNIEEFCQEMKTETLRVSETFGKEQFKTTLPDDYIEDTDIDSFFEALVFAVNQPNEIDLGDIINKELGECKNINLIDSKVVGDMFQIYILDWLKHIDGRILTHEDGNIFFKEAKQRIYTFMLFGLTKSYREKLKGFDIDFEGDPLGLKDVQNRFKKQIFIIINPHNTILSSIKLDKCLKDEKDDNIIFVPLSSFLRVKDYGIEAFKSGTSNNLLVLECKAAEEHVDDLYYKLLEVTQLNGKKKIILITQENNLKNKFPEDIRCEIEDGKNSLADLTDKSQQRLLMHKQVTFQGKKISLEKLISGETSIIDAEVLSKVIEEERIKVGSKVPQKSDHGSPAYNIIMPQEIKIERFKEEDIKNSLFVISEILEEKLINLGIAEENICSFDKCELNDKNIKQFILLSNKDHDKNIEDFETVCCNYSDKMIHLIVFKDNKFMWKCYYNPEFYTKHDLYKIEIDTTKLSEYAVKEDLKDNILVVSGTTEEEFKKKYKQIKEKFITSSNDVNLNGSHPIIILRDLDEKGFESLSNNNMLQKFCIHWLKYEETKLFWKQSIRDTSKLSELVKPTSTETVSLLDIVMERRSTVIADISGVGKSTTLTNLTQLYKDKKDVDWWVMRVNLRDWGSEIDKLPDTYDLEGVVNFFSVIDKEGLEGTLAKNLFKHRLIKKKNILLLFDGFDEISSGQKEDTGQSTDKQKKFCDLLKFLNNKATIVVTTRPYENEKGIIENALSVLSHTFTPIENEKLLTNLWKGSLKPKYSEKEYDDIAQGLICKFNKAVKKEKSTFMSIPLHLRMFAEIHLEKLIKNCQNDDFKELDIFHLYEEFVMRKYEIYFIQKTRLSSAFVTNVDLDILREQYEKMHKHLAFKYLFSKSTEPFKLFFSAESVESSFFKNKMPKEEKTGELKRIGIITQSRSNHDIDFLHRTFAEYFVAKLIHERLKQKLENPNYSPDSKDKMRKFVLNHVFIKSENNVIRSFINSKLDPKSAILEKFWSGQIIPVDNKKQQLLLAVKEGLVNIFSFLLHSEEGNSINKELVSVPREHIKELCDKGEYREADLFPENALEFLKELGDDHLEIAILQRYLGNACGDLAESANNKEEKEGMFKRKIENNKKALSIFDKHIKVAKEYLQQVLSTFDKHIKVAKHSEKYLQQALSTFKQDFEHIEAQTTKDLCKVWIKVLEIEKAQVERNLANAYGDLKNHIGKQQLLIYALCTFAKYGDELGIAKTERNLGNTYGEIAELVDDKMKRKFLETKEVLLQDALHIFTKKGSILNIAETKRNMGTVYGKLAMLENDEKKKKEMLWEKKKFLEEALPELKKHYGLRNPIVTKAQRNLSKAYKALKYHLHGAVIAGNSEKVKEIIKEGSEHQTNDDLCSPLYLAVLEGHSDVVKLLLQEKQVDPVIDYLVKELKLYKAPQIYQKIKDILENHFIKQ